MAYQEDGEEEKEEEEAGGRMVGLRRPSRRRGRRWRCKFGQPTKEGGQGRQDRQGKSTSRLGAKNGERGKPSSPCNLRGTLMHSLYSNFI